MSFFGCYMYYFRSQFFRNAHNLAMTSDLLKEDEKLLFFLNSLALMADFFSRMD